MATIVAAKHYGHWNKCIGKSSFKTIAVTVDKELFEKMHYRLQTSKARRLKKLRSSTVEPVLGTLVNFLGMRRVYTKGVSLADKCITMAAIAYNLKKLLKWEDEKRLEDAKTLQQRIQVAYLMLRNPLNASGCYYNLAFKKRGLISCKN